MAKPKNINVVTNARRTERKVKAIERDRGEAEWSLQERRMLRHLLVNDHLYFMRYFMRKRENVRMMVNGHHPIVANTLDQVYSGRIKRLIINIPPGYTKTEAAVIAFMARGLAINPAARFIHTSYSEDLALLNSSLTRDVVCSEAYQELWPIALRADSTAKKRWNTTFGGGIMAAPIEGQITGFRAGRMGMPGFTGAMLIDDPIKPKSAHSDAIRNSTNMQFTTTLRNRLAHEDIPVILIMQRTHEDDPSGFLLRGGSGDLWHHLCIPIEIPSKPLPYPDEYTHGIEIPWELPPGPLWRYKHDEEALSILKVDPYTFAAQGMQQPAPLGGGIFKDDWWGYYNKLPNRFKAVIIYGDTAAKTKSHNDFSVFLIAGLGYDDNLYLLDLIRGKWEAPELLMIAENFWKKHRRSATRPQGAMLMKVEDKSSGTGLIQQLNRKIGKQIIGIPRDADKVSRAMSCAPMFASRRVLLPQGPTALTDAEWVTDFKLEFSRFTPRMTHKHDDQVDVTLDAVEDLLINQGDAALIYKNL